MNFNPRSRTGSDGIFSRRSSSTASFQPTLPHGERPSGTVTGAIRHTISTHAPARGATPFRVLDQPREGAISTHAPARGATRIARNSKTARSYFNPRSRTGSDVACVVLDGRARQFQPTLPHGERRGSHKPRHHNWEISTHAPARGATRAAGEEARNLQISTHAPARGATLMNGASDCGPTISTHAPRTGSDRPGGHGSRKAIKFQPTLPARGAT